MDSYYKILGVKNFASPEEIRIAYRKLAKELHPDVNGGDKLLEEKFKVVQFANEILSNSNSKQSYDEILKRSLQITNLKSISKASSNQLVRRPSYILYKGRFVKRRRF